MLLRQLVLFLFLLSAFSAYSHPVRPKGTLSLMLDSMPDSTQYDTIYSLQYYLGIGLRYYRQEFLDQEESKSLLPMISFLVARWNQENSQANIYAYGGLGTTNFVHQKSETTYFYGIQADWESEKYFTMLKHEKIESETKSIKDYWALRGGFSAYKASYYEMWTWYMLQLSTNRAREDKVDLTPLFRFFYKNILWEVGVSHRGDTMINLMLDY